MTRDLDASTGSSIGRREAIRRAALLAGVALSAEWLSLAASAQAPAGKTYFAPAQRATLTAAVERILPKTDTPGAIDVGVPAFLDRFYGEFMTPEEKQLLVAALDGIEQGAMSAHKAAFASLPAAQQDAVLKSIATAQQGTDPSPTEARVGDQLSVTIRRTI